MQLMTMSCPACGAPVNFAENTLVVLCAYCRSQVARAQDEPQINLEQALQALRNVQYEQADLSFTEILRRNPQDAQAWLGRAVTTALKPYGSATEALAFFQESRFSTEDAIAWLLPLTTASSTLFDDFLKGYKTLPAPALSFSIILLEAALHSQNPAHQDRIAKTYTALAEQAWQAGQVEQAKSFMRQALQIDPTQRPQNLWLFELAQQ